MMIAKLVPVIIFSSTRKRIKTEIEEKTPVLKPKLKLGIDIVCNQCGSLMIYDQVNDVMSCKYCGNKR